MALCDVDYVRAHIYTGTLSDADITAIITEVTEDVLAQCNTTLETDPLVILAGKYATLAAVLTRMKTTGEMAASVTTGNGQRQNTTDVDIERYEKKAHACIAQYNSYSSFSFSSPSMHQGLTSNGGCHGRY